MSAALVLATEGGIPYDAPLAKLAAPLGILIFLGLPYMLLRSNLGTRRAYLVLTASFFGFMLLLSLFWAFGAPGTPALTGPTNLPGTVPDEYQPVWVPFAEDSVLAGREPYASLVADPSAFSAVPEGETAAVDTAITDTKSFFSASPEESGFQPSFQDTWEAVPEETGYAVAANGQPVVRMVFGATYQLTAEGQPPEGITPEQIGTVIPEGEEDAGRFVGYAFFDAGNPIFPTLVFFGLSLLGFLLHAALLFVDEQRERRERTAVVETPEERVPAGV